jgi:hypothetical protein
VVALWTVSRALQIPLDIKVRELPDTPYTISYIVRKRIQIDNLSELPKDKQVPEKMLWDGDSDQIGDWIDRVMDHGGKKKNMAEFIISDVEG